ncbi:MAG: hypothetical protein ACMUIP_12880 [bacterium]
MNLTIITYHLLNVRIRSKGRIKMEKCKKFKRSHKGERVTITGIITPIDWDEENRIIAGSLSTPHEIDYILEKSPARDKLLKLTSEYVSVTGIMGENEFGEKSIFVERYKLLPYSS